MENHNPEAAKFLKELDAVTTEDVKAGLEQMPAEECLDFCRDFVELMAKWQPEQINPDDDVLKAAAFSIYLAKLFPLAFEKAYIHSDKVHSAKESIRKAFQ